MTPAERDVAEEDYEGRRTTLRPRAAACSAARLITNRDSEAPG
jgi:hypothetical protein